MKLKELFNVYKKSTNWKYLIIIYGIYILYITLFSPLIFDYLIFTGLFFLITILGFFKNIILKYEKNKIGIMAGCFDVIHPGYIYMFEEANKNCDKLIVLLQSDPTIDRPEKIKPILSINERIKILESIKYIDEIITYDTEKELYDLLKNIKPDVRFLGDDYIGKDINGGDLNIKIIYINRNHGWSSTKFKQLIFDQLYNK